MRSTLFRRFAVVGVSAAVGVVLLLAFLLDTQRTLEATVARSEHSGDVLVTAATAERLATQVLTATSTSLLAPHGSLARELRSTRPQVAPVDRRLVGLVRDNPAQTRRARAIQAIDRQVVAWSERSVGAGRTGAAAPIAKGNRLRRVLRARYERFLDAEEALLAERRARASTLRHRGNIVGAAALVLIPLGIAALLFAAVATLLRPLQRLARVVERIERGDDRAVADTGGIGEIGTLQNAVNSMSAAISDRRRRILDHAPIAIWEQIGSRLLWVSPHWNVIAGLPAGAPMTLESIDGLVHPDDRESRRETRDAGIAGGGAFEYRYRLVRPDGQIRHMWTRVTPIGTDASGAAHVIGFSLDVTEDQTTREQLFHAQRLESVGQLAGGIAHDFNNLLTVIAGYVSLARSRIDAPAEIAKALARIDEAEKRAAALTHQLLAFSRKQILQPELLDVNEVVDGVLPMLHRLIEEAVVLRTAFARNLPRVLFDRGQLEQVLVNLIVNARDATVDAGGVVLVETSAVELDATYANAHEGAREGPHVCLTVSDTGTGMDAETMTRIFDPFFTTKEVGRGTGLGLATVHGIVAQSGGNIWVYSEPGRGTTFKVYIPTAAQPAGGGSAPRPASAGAPAVPPAPSARVLVVDDDDNVRALVAEVLESAGHDVATASTLGAAREALAAEHVDVVVTDLNLPDGDGSDLAGPDGGGAGPELVVMSGYTAQSLAPARAIPGTAYLEKPFAPSELVAAVSAALARNRTNA